MYSTPINRAEPICHPAAGSVTSVARVVTTFGGDGVTTFALPKLTPLQSGSQPLECA
jgi:hypothetical protein